MKRIAFFISSLQKGGSERVVANLVEYFHAKGYEVLLVTQYKRAVEYEISPEIKRVYSEPAAELVQGGRIHNFWVRYQTMRNIWKDFKPDVMVSFIGKNNFMATITALGLPVKAVSSVRGEPHMEYPGWQAKATRFFFAIADGVILQTEQSKSFFSKRVAKKAVVLPNPLNPLFLREKYEGEREPVIIAAGRLDENKNHAMLIKAFAKVADEFPKMRVMICGEGESRPKLEKMIEEYGLQGRVELPGSVSDLSERLYKASIFVLTSNTEGLPNSLMEAMALGVPSISTDCPCGGPAMLIEDGENGLLIPVGDADALSKAFRKILSDSKFAEKLSDNAYEITKELHPDKVNSEWEKYFHELVK